MKNQYEINGYRDRQHYLDCLSNNYEADIDEVCALADLLGANEDFDGLVNAVQEL